MTIPPTAEELYNQVVRALPPSQRLKLATMILNDIPPQSVVDFDESWSEQDVHEFNTASWQYILGQVEAEESDAHSG